MFINSSTESMILTSLRTYKNLLHYLNGRKAYTLYNNSKSRQRLLKTGVPQGGVLSPILLDIYTSDFPTPPTQVQIESYADDTNTLTSHSKIKEAEKRLQPYLNY